MSRASWEGAYSQSSVAGVAAEGFSTSVIRSIVALRPGGLAAAHVRLRQRAELGEDRERVRLPALAGDATDLDPKDLDHTLRDRAASRRRRGRPPLEVVAVERVEGSLDARAAVEPRPTISRS